MDLLNNDNPPYVVTNISNTSCLSKSEDDEDFSFIKQNYVALETNLSEFQINNNQLTRDANSLFLSVARALIHQLIIRPKYEFHLRHFLNLSHDVKLYSDINLQHIIRRNLCLYWLKFIENSQYKPECEYQR